jgi:hypothetical protein
MVPRKENCGGIKMATHLNMVQDVKTDWNYTPTTLRLLLDCNARFYVYLRTNKILLMHQFHFTSTVEQQGSSDEAMTNLRAVNAIPNKYFILLLLHSVQTGSGTNSVSCSNRCRGFLPKR